ncbi:MAG: N-acetylneuraminate synthase family protein [Gammaproteobacteria bacterium]|nr:N-acetylneuraminate synthase family protein [Gammaproteobacteria bacterium]
MHERVTVIAEIGSNYNGDLALAREYVRAARECGADVVKFQTLRKNKLVAPRLYSGDGAVSENPVYRNFASLELPDEWHYELKELADQLGIEFMSTPFYLEAVELLESVGVRSYKIASGDITFRPLLDKIGRTGKRVVLSTGASADEEISAALQVLKKAGAMDVALLHCVSNYPPAWDEMNLRAIASMQARFGCPIGISDHTPGCLVPLSAVALGASLIEKHVTFDRSQNGPDHAFAMTPGEFAEMVAQVRLLQGALGDGHKQPTASELAKQRRIRRGVYNPRTLEPQEGEEGLWLRPAPENAP